MDRAKDGSSPVLLTVDARGVASLTLNRPEVNNAYDEALLQGLHEAADAITASQASSRPVRCVVLRGAGHHFQAGADLGWLGEVRSGSPEGNLAASRLTADAVRKLEDLPIPLVALVHGACFGGGTGIISASDVVLADKRAMFSIAEGRWGLHASIILPQLANAVGVRQLRRYALTGERFDAAEAARIGLVHEVVPAEEIESRGSAVVGAILACAPGAVMATKRLARTVGDDRLFDDLIDEHSHIRQSAEAGEGLAAFAGKRSPNWVPKPDEVGPGIPHGCIADDCAQGPA